jgi:hypothetical protein
MIMMCWTSGPGVGGAACAETALAAANSKAAALTTIDLTEFLPDGKTA